MNFSINYSNGLFNLFRIIDEILILEKVHGNSASHLMWIWHCKGVNSAGHSKLLLTCPMYAHHIASNIISGIYRQKWFHCLIMTAFAHRKTLSHRSTLVNVANISRRNFHTANNYHYFFYRLIWWSIFNCYYRSDSFHHISDSLHLRFVDGELIAGGWNAIGAISININFNCDRLWTFPPEMPLQCYANYWFLLEKNGCFVFVDWRLLMRVTYGGCLIGIIGPIETMSLFITLNCRWP